MDYNIKKREPIENEFKNSYLILREKYFLKHYNINNSVLKTYKILKKIRSKFCYETSTTDCSKSISSNETNEAQQKHSWQVMIANNVVMMWE